MDFYCETAFAGRVADDVNPKKQIAGSIDVDFLAAAYQLRSSLRPQFCDQGSRERGGHGHALSRCASHALRITVLRTTGGDVESVAGLEIYACIGPGLGRRDIKRVVASGCRGRSLRRALADCERRDRYQIERKYPALHEPPPERGRTVGGEGPAFS